MGLKIEEQGRIMKYTKGIYAFSLSVGKRKILYFENIIYMEIGKIIKRKECGYQYLSNRDKIMKNLLDTKIGKALATVFALVVVIGGVFIFRSVNQQEELPTEVYLAGGTIPSSAKIYPIIFEDLPMAVQTDEGVITEEDIYKLTKYIDLKSGFYDTRNPDNLPAADECTFLDDYQETVDIFKDWDYEVTGVQLLTIETTDKADEVAITYAVTLTGHGCDYYEEYTEDSDRIMISGGYWKHIGDNWYTYGSIYFVGDWQVDSVKVYRDYTTGRITVGRA